MLSNQPIDKPHNVTQGLSTIIGLRTGEVVKALSDEKYGFCFNGRPASNKEEANKLCGGKPAGALRNIEWA